MNQVKIEAFFSKARDSNDVRLSQLLDEIKQDFGDKVEIATLEGRNELFEEYGLTATPAVVIEEMVKVMGFCPSKETLVSALHEAGVA